MVDPEARRSSQETPRRAPRAPKRRPREPQNAFKTIFGSKMMIFQKSSSRPLIKSIFLRVGRSVWELKFDPKRLREEIKNDIEKRRKKRDEQKSLKGDKKSSKKL